MSNKVKNMRSWLLMLFAAISLSVSAQTITVKGNVKDTTGEPIIGASVVEKGNTTNGTITDLDGRSCGNWLRNRCKKGSDWFRIFR